jgi:phage/plasmid primase-like uncharacterized protein
MMNNNAFIDFASIKNDAFGRWSSILTTVAPGAFDEAIAVAPRHTACPKKGGRDGFRLDRSFRNKGVAYSNSYGTLRDGFELLAWYFDVPVREAFLMVSEVLGGNSVVMQAPVVPVEQKKGDYNSVIKLWNAASPYVQAIGSKGLNAARLYFQSRGLREDFLKNKAIRYVDNLIYEKNADGTFTRFCGFVCSVRNAKGELETLHKYFLTEDGKKAPVANPRKLMGVSKSGNISGSFINLFEVGEIIGVAEGLETALAAYQLTQVPTLPVLNTNGMEKFVVPNGVKTVVIFADKDVSEAGQKASNSLRKRLMADGVNAIRVMPKESIPINTKSIDWNDVLVNGWQHPTCEQIMNFIDTL